MQTTDLLVRSWSPGSDVRQQSISSILQASNGYLWVATGRGLMRFDGVSFAAFTTTNTSGLAGDSFSFNTLLEDRAGVLWAGTYNHGVVRNDHGHFSTLGKEQGLADLNVMRIDADETGATWVYTVDGVSRWLNGHLEQVHPERDSPNPPLLLAHDHRRTIDFEKMGLWRRTPQALERFAYGRWNSFPVPPAESRPFEHDVKSIYEDHLHRIWYSVFSQPGRYFCVRNGVLSRYEGLPKDAFVTYQDSSGFLWLNQRTLQAQRWKEGKLYPVPELHTPYLVNVIETADGTTWAGTGGTMLFQYRPRLISAIATPGAPEIGSVLFQQRSGAIWAGGTDLLHLQTGLQTGQNGSLLRPLFRVRKDWDTIEALSEDAQGHLLIGSRNHLGGEVLDRKRLRPYLSRGFDNSTIRAMLLSSTGDQWIGTDTGLYRYRNGRVKPPERVWSGAVRCLHEAQDQIIWAGTDDGPLRFEDGQPRSIATGPPWNFGHVRSISVDRFGELWIVTTEHGVVHLANGAVRAFSTADGLPTNAFYSVDFGDDDDLWLRSDIGLIRIRRNSIEHRLADRTSKLQVTLFDRKDGLPSSDMGPSGNQGFLRFKDGTLWFSSFGGIASLRPADIIEKASTVRAVMEEHAIDLSGPVPSSPIVMTPGQRNLEIHYTALGSTHPEQVNFRYRLRGFDPEWISAGTRRVAYYTQLPAGDYLFEVQAADGDSDGWKLKGVSTAVQVQTPFYRSWWFTALVSCAVLGTIRFILATRRENRRRTERMRQAFTHQLITTQETERKRIAHELHDSLGQHLVLIRTLAMLPSMPLNGHGDPLSAIADQAAQAIQEVQTISYDLRPYQLDRLGLTKAVLSSIHAVEAHSTLVVERSVENIDGFLPKDLEISFYRIVQEALGNVLKHAGATQVSVHVTRTDTTLRLSIVDNGCGFSQAAGDSEPSGLGLVGIRERAEALGGRASVVSSEGSGTSVAVEITKKGSETQTRMYEASRQAAAERTDRRRAAGEGSRA